MKELKKRILEDGVVLNSTILKVDRFLNHQIDPMLMHQIGEAFAKAFANEGITKVLTLESSGIAPAVLTGLALEVPVIFVRKKKPITLNTSLLTTEIYSYTKNVHNTVYLEKDIIQEQDKCLIIDDFLANGEAALGLTRLIEQSRATVSGIGIVIEKSFQEGRAKLDRAGYSVFALARISSLTDNKVHFLDE
ncbi:xanthine phosphoribosyltransferase [Sporolactobacillus kofuensis]|uniref:Xanthine phosphoribosyltransferase n=1 Tax=Sporolactobacillus kofuensis TaxID=269672 RepID=A0ABW1WEC6_9BACL|nr:xanthine phosphoribosyltransferase [Sporolactobacillus kofuensis]MCO7176198.1 xanthine phosphoribosyltransferase [Sporolactobacillus kofuensis]